MKWSDGETGEMQAEGEANADRNQSNAAETEAVRRGRKLASPGALVSHFH